MSKKKLLFSFLLFFGGLLSLIFIPGGFIFDNNEPVNEESFHTINLQEEKTIDQDLIDRIERLKFLEDGYDFVIPGFEPVIPDEEEVVQNVEVEESTVDYFSIIFSYVKDIVSLIGTIIGIIIGIKTLKTRKNEAEA